MSIHLIMQLLVLAGEIKTEGELTQRLEAVLDVYSFGFYRLSLQPTVQEPSRELALAVRWPKGWAEVYRFKKYASVDPAARLLPTAQRPYRLREAAFALRNEPHRARMQRLIQDAARHGIRDGYVFPVHGRTGLLGSLLVSGKPVDLSPAELTLFDTVARTMFWRYLELRGWAAELEKFGPFEVSLTKREVEVVTHLAEGLTSHEIARELQISNHTVDWYINGLQDKMKARNRQHVVALAFRRGLVS
ncbi:MULTISPECIES: helix-turn-helix transcriptional regulator [Pseudorhizobium]|uniref:helix-turn-helix transcriptional regulator n=1 Tax=Pseudorhizobium TaxID=1903858 RepID=UPI000497B53C|nr:autoinducer binding domain-containing protein [Pseudorhizobium marinum]MBA4785182.1 autoinducer binding domain-containing protein [Hyphomicrobiales bacterium]MDY6960975.1 autoinducer binding domain-containing protein [Pseudomonadota bacterium]